MHGPLVRSPSRTPLASSLLGLALLASAAHAAAVEPAAKPATEACVAAGTWQRPGQGAVSAVEVLRQAAAQQVVLLGEAHDSAEHHRWQLHVLAQLLAQRPRLVIALEMLPRRVQPVLDRWVAGALSEEAFLRESNWREVWGADAALYLPIFHFARMHRVPLVAANVGRALTRAVSEQGFEAVPESQREGLTPPAAAAPGYVDLIWQTAAEHMPDGKRPAQGRQDPAFQRLVEAQLVWDRAMAQAIRDALASDAEALVVGLMGEFHVRHGWGVAHQLRALGVTRIAGLLPWDVDRDCGGLTAGVADAVFGVAPPAAVATPRPRLGVALGMANQHVRIEDVSPDSVAAKTGLQQGDLVLEIAGTRPRSPGDVADVVGSLRPGLWLPLTIERDGERMSLVAKFPARP